MSVSPETLEIVVEEIGGRHLEASVCVFSCKRFFHQASLYMEISVLDGPFPNSDVNRINIEHPFRIRVDRYVRDTFASIFPASISGVVLDLGVGNMIILEKFSIDSIRKAFAELEEMAPSLELDTVKVEGEDKYVDREYAFEAITSK